MQIFPPFLIWAVVANSFGINLPSSSFSQRFCDSWLFITKQDVHMQ